MEHIQAEGMKKRAAVVADAVFLKPAALDKRLWRAFADRNGSSSPVRNQLPLRKQRDLLKLFDRLDVLRLECADGLNLRFSHKRKNTMSHSIQ